MDIGTIEAALKLRDDASATIAKFGKNLQGLSSVGREVGESMSRVGVGITAGIAVPLGAVIKIAKDFESAFANVVKTVEGFDVDPFGELNERAQAFRDSIIDLSREIPIAADELANIAGIGGQFGVAQGDLLDFTETVGKLGVAIDGIEAETAAASLAQIANVTREGAGAFTEYANVLVDLGNKGNSTEGEILEFAKRLAGAGSQAKLSGSEIFGLGAAMANVGLNAEAGGTAMSKLLSQMSRAGAEGEAASQKFADFAGRIDATAGSGAGFAKIFKEDASKALELFFDGLSDAAAKGQNLNVILSDLGVNEVRQRDTMLRLAGAQGELAKSFKTAGDAARDQTALNDEARKKFATFDNQLKLFLNSVRAVAIEIGTPLLRALNSALQSLEPLTDAMVKMARVFADLPPAAHQVVLALGVGAGVAGVLLLLGGQAARAVVDIKTLITTLNVLSGVQVGAAAVSTAAGLTQAGVAAAGAARSTVVLTDAWRDSLVTATATTTAANTAAVGWGTMAARAGVATGAILALSAASAAGKVYVANMTQEWGTFGEVIRGLDNPIGALVDHFRLMASALDDIKRAREGIPLNAPSFVPLAPEMFSKAATKLELPSTDDLNRALAGTEALRSKAESLRAAVAALSADTRKGITDLDSLGLSTKEIAVEMRLAEEVVVAYQKTASAAAVTQKALAKETAVTSEAFVQFAKEGVGAVAARLEAMGALDASTFDNLTASMLDLNKAIRATGNAIDLRKQTQGLSKEFAALVGRTQAFTREMEDLADEAKKADPALQSFYDRLKELKQLEWAQEIAEGVVATDEFYDVLLMINPQMAEMVRLAKLTDQTQAAAKESTTSWTDGVSELAKAFGNLAQVAGKGTGFSQAVAEIVSGADVALKAFKSVQAGIADLADKTKGSLADAFSNIAVGLISGVAGLAGATAPGQSFIAKLIGGATQGAALGASMGVAIAGAAAKGASMAGVWGAVAGAVLGILVAYWRSEQVMNTMRRVGEEWGVEISEGLAMAINADRAEINVSSRNAPRIQDQAGHPHLQSQAFRQTAADVLHLSEILNEAVGGLNDLNFDELIGNFDEVWLNLSDGTFDAEQALSAFGDAFRRHLGSLNSENVDQLIGAFNGLFDALEAGSITTDVALRLIGDNFDAFAQRIIESGEFAGQEFIRLLSENISSGLRAPEIIAFITEGASRVGAGLAAMLAPIVPVAQAIGDRVRAAQKALDALAKDGKKDTKEYADAVAELTEAIRHQGEVAGLAAGDLENIGIVALSAFNAAIAGGASMVQAIMAISPALDAIIEAQKNLGITSENTAIQQLIRYRELVVANQDLVNAAGALNSTLVALQQIGGLTTKSLAAMEDQGLRTFRRLVEAGFTENEALAQMADFLKNVEKAHKQLGTPIDANTQALIDQARAAGLLGDDTVDATTQQRRGFEMVTQAINRLIETLGGVPIAIDDISQAINDKLPDHVTIPIDFELPDDFPQYPDQGGPRGPGRQPPTPEEGQDPFGDGSSPYDPAFWDPGAVDRATAAARSTEPEIVIEVPVELDGETLTRVVARRLPEYTELFGGPSSRTTV